MARSTKVKPFPTPTGEGVEKRTKKELICSIVPKKTKEKFVSQNLNSSLDFVHTRQPMRLA